MRVMTKVEEVIDQIVCVQAAVACSFPTKCTNAFDARLFARLKSTNCCVCVVFVVAVVARIFAACLVVVRFWLLFSFLAISCKSTVVIIFSSVV